MLYSSSNEQVVDRYECEHMLSSLGRRQEFNSFMDVHLSELHQRFATLNLQLRLVFKLVRVDLDYYLNFTAISNDITREWSVLLNSLDAVFILNAFGKCCSASNATQLSQLIWTSLQDEISSMPSISSNTPWSGSSESGHSFSPI